MPAAPISISSSSNWSGPPTQGDLDYTDPALREFNDSLDSQQDALVFGEDARFAPSYVLYTLEPGLYYQYYLDWKLQQQAAIREYVPGTFPLPIAYPFHIFEWGYEDETQRLIAFKDTWEGAIFLLYAMVVGEFRSRNLPMLGTTIKAKDLLSNSLDDKIEIISQLMDCAEANGYDLDCTQVIPRDAVERLRKFNRVRNDFIAHIAAKSHEQSRKLIDDYMEDMLALLYDLRGLQSVKLLRYVNSPGGPRNLRCEIFTGETNNRTHNILTVTMAQLIEAERYINPDNILFAVEGGHGVYSLSPYIHYKRATGGQRTYLRVYKQKSGTEPNYRFSFETIGEAEEEEVDGAPFMDAVNEIRALLPDLSRGKGGTRS